VLPDKKEARNLRREAAEVTQVICEAGAVSFRKYQKSIFLDRTSGIVGLHWSRQIGKSYTLAGWAVDRLLSQLQKYDTWLITVLSNSRDNGAEFNLKCQEVCRKMGMLLVRPSSLGSSAAVSAPSDRGSEESDPETIGGAAVYFVDDQSPDIKYENMRMEVRVTVMIDGRERTGRIKVLAANPRTARGFSGDLILDEFAFHEDSAAIWDAAEPILSANPEFLCRIASTGNGKHNMFFRMFSGAGPSDGTLFQSTAGYLVSRVTRTEAWKMGVKVYDLRTRAPIEPSQARVKALDKKSYDQNYECLFNDENMVLLTWELINAAERGLFGIDEQGWSPATMARLFRAKGELYAGQDVGRNRDLSYITVIEMDGNRRRVIAVLRMQGMRLPDQQRELDKLCMLPKFRRIEIDMTGLGLGLVEYAQEKWGVSRVGGINFATTEPINDRIREEGRKAEKARVTEIMATEMLGCFEDRTIDLEVILDEDAKEDLRKPERITSEGGKVSIAAVRDEAGHADFFWSVGLAIRASMTGSGPWAYESLSPRLPGEGTMGSESQFGRVVTRGKGTLC
jgi:phage FluMu gp28-like protein